MRLNPPDVYDSHIVPIVRSYSAIKDIIASLEFARPDYDDRLVIAHIENIYEKLCGIMSEIDRFQKELDEAKALDVPDNNNEESNIKSIPAPETVTHKKQKNIPTGKVKSATSQKASTDWNHYKLNCFSENTVCDKDDDDLNKDTEKEIGYTDENAHHVYETATQADKLQTATKAVENMIAQLHTEQSQSKQLFFKQLLWASPLIVIGVFFLCAGTSDLGTACCFAIPFLAVAFFCLLTPIRALAQAYWINRDKIRILYMYHQNLLKKDIKECPDFPDLSVLDNPQLLMLYSCRIIVTLVFFGLLITCIFSLIIMTGLIVNQPQMRKDIPLFIFLIDAFNFLVLLLMAVFWIKITNKIKRIKTNIFMEK